MLKPGNTFNNLAYLLKKNTKFKRIDRVNIFVLEIFHKVVTIRSTLSPLLFHEDQQTGKKTIMAKNTKSPLVPKRMKWQDICLTRVKYDYPNHPLTPSLSQAGRGMG